MKLVFGIFVLLLFNLQAIIAQNDIAPLNSISKLDYCKNELLEFSLQTDEYIIKGKTYKNIDGFSFCVNNEDTVSFDGMIYLIVPNPKLDILAIFVSYEKTDSSKQNLMAEGLYFYFSDRCS